MERVRSAMPAMIVALLLGLVLGGGAVAAVSIPDGSIGCNKLTPKLQKRVGCGPASTIPRPTLQGVPGPVGPTGSQGEIGAQGPSGAIEPRCELAKVTASSTASNSGDCRRRWSPLRAKPASIPNPPSA
jgi:hypothetical protein